MILWCVERHATRRGARLKGTRWVGSSGHLDNLTDGCYKQGVVGAVPDVGGPGQRGRSMVQSVRKSQSWRIQRGDPSVSCTLRDRLLRSDPPKLLPKLGCQCRRRWSVAHGEIRPPRIARLVGFSRYVHRTWGAPTGVFTMYRIPICTESPCIESRRESRSRLP